jgi:Pyruvate/2-oxoacid:ferredoxin oxidoreductase delta subunit
MLVDIYEEARPALTLVDGITAMEGDGPATSGKLRNPNVLLAGHDCVALDSIMALIMGIKPNDVLSTKEAAARELGLSRIGDIEVLGEKLEDVVGAPFLLPTTSMAKNIPLPVANLAKKLIRYYPCVEQDNCIKCAACIQACPTKAISMKKERIVFNYAKCIACFCCQEACPASAIKVKKSLLAKLIGL